jgi:predicted MFS family arabinose efflux permease
MSVSVSITILQLFLVDIGQTFGVSVGVASQIATANKIGEFVSALLVGALAVRFRYKPLILFGILLVLLSAIGSFLAPNFETLEIFFVLEGFGTVMFNIIAFTVIGDAFFGHKRAKAVSYLMAALMGTALISFPLSGLIANIVGWRFNFLLQTLPIGLVGLLLAVLTIPSKLRRQSVAPERASISTCFKQVLKDKSATACLISKILASAGAMFSIFLVAFLRENFSVSVNLTVIISMITFSIFIVGSLLAGRIANIIGALYTTIIPSIFFGIFLMIIFFITNLWIVLICNFLMAGISSVSLTGSNCLALAQVSKNRGTMIGLYRAVESVGSAIGPVIGGALLVLTIGFYGAVGVAFGAMFVISAIVLFLWAKENDLISSVV